MGAWGHGYFEDDAALDFMADLEDSSDPKAIITNALDHAIHAEFLDADEGNAVNVSATFIDRQLNGTTFSEPEREKPLEVDTFPDRHPEVDLSDLRGKAVLALQKLLGETSELKELWEENEEDYPSWRRGVEQLIQRLDR